MSAPQSSCDILYEYRPLVTQPRARIFCFPCAGRGASFFRSWTKHLPSDIEVCPIQLPGRESRLSEVPFTRIEPLIQAVVEEITPYLNTPFVLLGHSMGALIAFEVARLLQSQGIEHPSKLIVAACRAPHIPRVNLTGPNVSDYTLLDILRCLNGTPSELLDHPEFMSIVLPILRADFTLIHNYTYAASEPLNLPIVALGGDQDETTQLPALEAWEIHTSSMFNLHLLPGGHFFIETARRQCMEIILEELRSAIP